MQVIRNKTERMGFMDFSIEIKEGRDSSSYFLFMPIMINDNQNMELDDDVEREEVFSIEEDNVDCFLAYFLFKYFDENLVYNKNRYEEGEIYIKGFNWYLTPNYFTYDVINKMLGEIMCVAKLLKTDYDNVSLNEIKKRFSICYMCPSDSDDYKNENKESIKNNISVVIDFYDRFVARLQKMMDNNPNTDLICIIGP